MSPSSSSSSLLLVYSRSRPGSLSLPLLSLLASGVAVMEALASSSFSSSHSLASTSCWGGRCLLRSPSAVSSFIRRISITLIILHAISLPQHHYSVVGQWAEDCSNAPTPEAKRVCLELRRQDRLSRQKASTMPALTRPAETNEVVGSPVWQPPIPVPWNSRGQAAGHPYDCMTLQCLCPFFQGRIQLPEGHCMLPNGAALLMGYRKEYRQLTAQERERFHYAMNEMKRRGEYDRFSMEHQAMSEGSSAHSGPGFLPWHREFLKRFEIALRLIDPMLAVPYWDSVMDGYLPDPRDSIIFSNLFFGDSDMNGYLMNGPYAFWGTLEGRSTPQRVMATAGQLFREDQLASITDQTNIEYVLAYTTPQEGCPYPLNYNALEYLHTYVHLWLGGDMQIPRTSANDPIFYMHHSFVDLVWESWRTNRQPKWVREYVYSTDNSLCSSPLHFSYAPMAPFPNLHNRDGLSNAYTDQMYRYAPRPRCDIWTRNCHSDFLFCDTRGSYPHCVSRIKYGGRCTGFEYFSDSCYAGRCVSGRCV